MSLASAQGSRGNRKCQIQAPSARDHGHGEVNWEDMVAFLEEEAPEKPSVKLEGANKGPYVNFIYTK